MTVALSPTSIAAFVLTVAAGLLWLPKLIASRHSSRAWMVPALLAAMLAFAGDLVDWRGLVALLAVAASCVAARRAPDKSARLVAHAVVVALCAGFFLHVVPGFNNPRVIDAVLIGEGASSYSKYLNFDKGMAGVLLLGLYIPERVRNDDAARRFTAFAWRFAIMVGVVVTVAMASGYARWDPKLPDWSALWAWSMLVLTALPEEAAFRGVIQEKRSAMKASLLIGSLMLTLVVVTIRAPDVSGVWSLRLLTTEGDSAARATVTLKQDGETLTGTCVIEQMDQELTVAGQVTSDNTLTWRCAGKGSFEASFKATIDSTGRQMTGEWTTKAPTQGTFKGSRPAK